jgi:hypothetical protein
VGASGAGGEGVAAGEIGTVRSLPCEFSNGGAGRAATEAVAPLAGQWGTDG